MKTRVADPREQTGEWPEMTWESVQGKDLGLYPMRNRKPLEVFKQKTDMVRFVLDDHSPYALWRTNWGRPERKWRDQNGKEVEGKRK